MRLELPYVASFLDCDGTVVIVASNRKRKKTNESYVEYYAKVVFYNQNLSVICDLQETVGGAISPPNESLDNFCLQLSSKATVRCLKMILPWLRIKREQALVAIQLHEQISRTKRVSAHRAITGGGHYLADGVKDERRILCERIRMLNAKDPIEFRAFRTNWVNSGKPSMSEAILSQAAADIGTAEGATASLVSSNNNLDQERPARKGRDSLSSAVDTTIH